MASTHKVTEDTVVTAEAAGMEAIVNLAIEKVVIGTVVATERAAIVRESHLVMVDTTASLHTVKAVVGGALMVKRGAEVATDLHILVRLIHLHMGITPRKGNRLRHAAESWTHLSEAMVSSDDMIHLHR